MHNNYELLLFREVAFTNVEAHVQRDNREVEGNVLIDVYVQQAVLTKVKILIKLSEINLQKNLKYQQLAPDLEKEE